MQKIFFLALVLFLAFVSCKKDSSSTSSGSISATVNDTSATFNNSALAINTTANGVYGISITGFADNSNQISINISGPNPVTTGTYSFSTRGTGDQLSMGYSIPPNITYIQDSTSTANYATVVITAISSTSVQGTFTGDLKLFSGTSVVKTKSVTNGTFNVKFP